MPKTIVLFQQDLRLGDNPALTHAAKRGEVIPLYIMDDNNKIGGASKWWLHHSLLSLQQSLEQKGCSLLLKKGDTVSIINKLIVESKADAVYWNRCYEPDSIEKGKKLKASLESNNIEGKSFNAGLLFEPWEIFNKQGGVFKVFTPYWKYCLSKGSTIKEPLPIPQLTPFSISYKTENLDDWKLLPSKPNWAGGLKKAWQVGEKAAHEKLYRFLESRLQKYPETRNIPSDYGTSYLSPHLHFGEISPRQIWHAARHREAHTGDSVATEKFLSELGWREFSYYLLYNLPNIVDEPFNPKFANFPWEKNDAWLCAWQQGKTGYPIIDAGMCELWETGYMHNRVRMIAASFLTKDLLIHWKDGAAWFWDTLVDADLANNTASWQWVAGCGADASPYYRIFNPVLQGEKFDPEGVYVKKWLPQLANLPATYIHCPSQAPKNILQNAGIMLGQHYPEPIVDHNTARNKALQLYKENK